MSPELPPTLGAIADAPLSFRIFLIGGVAAFGGIFAGYDGVSLETCPDDPMMLT